MDYKEGWASQNLCFQIAVLEKTLERSLVSKIKPINPKGNQLWIFTGRTDAEAKTPILQPADAKSWRTGKTLILGKIEGRRKRRWQRMRWLDGITDLMDMSLSKLQDMVKDSKAWHATVYEVSKNRTLLSHWTTRISRIIISEVLKCYHSFT